MTFRSTWLLRKKVKNASIPIDYSKVIIDYAEVSLPPNDLDMNSVNTVPLITLQPVADFKNAWVALLLEGNTAFDNATLARLLNEHGLAGMLESIVCVASVDPTKMDPAFADGLPRELAQRFVLRFPVSVGADPAQHAKLAALHDAGFPLMTTGYPEAGATLFSGIASLAVTCPGHAMPAGFGDWLRKLPGPHLALGTTENVCPGFCKFHWLAGHVAGNASLTPQGDPTTRGLLLKMLSLVTTDADSVEIEALIKRDTNLSYHLLKLVNSVAFSPSKKIDNFAQAIALLGRRQLQRWLQLLLYARPQGSDTASPLMPRAALRAGLMEGLARRLGLSREQQDRAFMTGMFSLLDILFGVPLAGIIAPLNLSADVIQALTTGNGQLGNMLTAVTASEGPPSTVLADALAATGIAYAEWADTLAEAMRWAVQVSKES